MSEYMHIPEDHPALPGHFPGYPLVPAVVILDRVILCFEEQYKLTLNEFSCPQIKFLVPLFPNDEFEIKFNTIKPGRVDFAVVKDDVVYTKGRLSYEI